MKATIHDETLGTIVYNENFFTGKKTLSINGKDLYKESKNLYAIINEDGTRKFCSIKGNFIAGVRLSIDGTKIQVVKPIAWYEATLAILMFVFFMVWGSVPALCEIVPMVGGAIGGGISGLMAISSLIVMKLIKPVWAKILAWLGFFGATFGIIYGIAIAIISALS